MRAQQLRRLPHKVAPMNSGKRLHIIIVLIGIAIFLSQTVPLSLSPRHDNDFKHIYLGMKTLVDGGSPYSIASMENALKESGLRPDTPLNPYVYLPFTGLSFAPLYSLNIRQASNCMLWANILATLLALWFIAQACHGKTSLAPSPHLLPLAFAALCAITGAAHPLMRTLTAGQLNCILLLCISIAFLLIQRNRALIAGTILGYAAMFKIAPFIFAIYLLLTRNFKALLAMLITAFILLMGSVLICGIDTHADFLPMLRDMSYGKSTWHEFGNIFWKDATNQSLNSFFTHIMVADNGIATPWVNLTQSAANIATWIASLCLIVIFVICAHRARTSQTQEAAFHLALLLGLLFPSLLWDHYILLTILPVWWLIAHTCTNKRYITAFLLFILLGSLFMPWHFQAPMFCQGLPVVCMSLKLWPLLILYFYLSFIIVKSKVKD